MDKITFTLKEIRKHSPCQDGWKKLLKTLGSDYGDDTPITISQIIESNDLDDALWCLRSTPREIRYLWRHFVVDCAEQVKHLMIDERSLNALDVARKHALGNATDSELDVAWAASWDAAWDAAYATAAAWDAAWDANATTASWDAALDANAATALDAATSALDAATDAALDAQAELLKEYCRTGERVLSPERYFK